jgi:transposase
LRCLAYRYQGPRRILLFHLFGRQLFAVDGTRLKAVNSTDRNFTRDKLVTMIRSADERLADYLRRLDRTMPRRMGRVAVRRRT